MMADAEAVVQEDMSPAQSPLVTVSFQRDINRKKKYLEAEPKALGITQIGLSLFNITCASVLLANGLSHLSHEIPFYIASLLVLIAGSLAIAAQNLHLSVLRVCLGMQVVACGASFANMICTLVKMDTTPFFCWDYNDNDTQHGVICHRMEEIHTHLYSEAMFIQALLFAVSITLAVYCCKVVNCCGPALKMPVITVQVPPVEQ